MVLLINTREFTVRQNDLEGEDVVASPPIPVRPEAETT